MLTVRWLYRTPEIAARNGNDAVMTYGKSVSCLLATAAPLALVVCLLAPPAQAAVHSSSYYGHSARSVARDINCVHFRRTGPGALNQDAGICWVAGRRVNVITFRGPGQQRDWNEGARLLLPRSHWWANGKGALVTAKNGNKPAAQVGARRLPGQLRHGS